MRKCSLKNKECGYCVDSRDYTSLYEPACTLYAYLYGRPHEISKIEQCPEDKNIHEERQTE